MTRTMVAWIVIGVVTLTLGCRMCADTYDYCGPVVGDGCWPDASCHSTFRAGSILSGERHPVMLQPIPEGAIDSVYSGAEGAHSQPELDYTFSQPPDIQPELDYTFANDPGFSHHSNVVNDPAFANDPEIAGGRIISITDRKLEEAEAGAPQVAGGQTSDSEDGWTARKISTPSP